MGHLCCRRLEKTTRWPVRGGGRLAMRRAARTAGATTPMSPVSPATCSSILWCASAFCDHAH
eukprot:898412-Pyramimonas_sp.AAC.1